MEVADSLASIDGVHHHRPLRHRSRRSRLVRNVRRGWRRTRLRRTIISFILAGGAVWAGYWASMYILQNEAPTPAELGVEARSK